MGVLRDRMVREMSLREFAASTQTLYLATVTDLGQVPPPIAGHPRPHAGTELPAVPDPGAPSRVEFRQRGRLPAKPDVRGDLALLEEGDVLDEEREHPFALARWGTGVAPDGGEIGGEGEDALALRVAEGEPAGRALAVILLLGGGQGTEPRVPVSLQRVGNQSVGGIHQHVAVPGVVGLVLGAFDLPMTQTVGVLDAGLDFVLHGERQLERHRRHGLDQQLADGHIDLGAEDALAERVAEQLAAIRAASG